MIYLDHNASTPVAPVVLRAMLELLEGPGGNPSSGHTAGLALHTAIEHARAEVAALLGAEADEVLFTSGATEANNLAILGTVRAAQKRGVRAPHIVTSAVEHPAVREPCRAAQELGATLDVVGVDGFGRVDPDAVRRALRPETVLVSVMHANNETGTLQPIAPIAAVVRAHGALMHSDAAQSAGKIPVGVDELGVDLLTLAGHKMYAPVGVGALYLRSGVALEPLLRGANHQRGLRPGTESAPLAVALGAACRLARLEPCEHALHTLRERLWDGLTAHYGARAVLNGHPSARLPNTLHVSLLGHPSHELLARIPELAASAGSACHSGTTHVSEVLSAMGVPAEIGLCALRLSVGRTTSTEDIDRALILLTHLERES
jgi:cysteine desulfurase